MIVSKNLLKFIKDSSCYVFRICNRHSNTLATNTLTCGVLLSVGDIIQQRLEKAMGKQTSNKHDVTRTGNPLLLIQWLHEWIILLDYKLMICSYFLPFHYRKNVSCWTKSRSTASLLVYMAWQVVTKKNVKNGKSSH